MLLKPKQFDGIAVGGGVDGQNSRRFDKNRQRIKHSMLLLVGLLLLLSGLLVAGLLSGLSGLLFDSER